MKLRFLPALLVASLTLHASAPAQDGVRTPPSDPIMVELKALVDEVSAKLQNTPPTSEALAPELAKFDALLAKHAGEKTDAVANIALMKAVLYIQVLNDQQAGRDTLLKLKNDFPGTKAANTVDQILAQLERSAQTEATKAALIGKPAPELNFKWSSRKGLTTLSALKGQVVVLDFWATWCGPCIAELPNVKKVYAAYHDKGFEVIGITLENPGLRGKETPEQVADKMAAAKQKMLDFTVKQEMPWPQYFDGKWWKNDYAVKFGIQSIPAMFLLDKDGRVAATDARGEKLEAEVKRLLGL